MDNHQFMSNPMIAAADFKAHCLKIMDDVQKKKKSITISKRGKAVAKLVPIDDTPSPSLFGWIKGTVVELEDIISPIDEKWDTEENA